MRALRRSAADWTARRSHPIIPSGLFHLDYCLPPRRKVDIEGEDALTTTSLTQTPALTRLSIAVLALLVERPMHPYEMHRLMLERREDRLLKVRRGSLYHAVDRLTRDGMVQVVGTERAGNRPERTTYEVTGAGRAALTRRLTQMLAAPAEEYPEFALAVAEMHNLTQPRAVDLLEQRAALLHERLDALHRGIEEAAAAGVHPVYRLDVTYSTEMARAELCWLDRLVHDLRSGALAWPEHVEPLHGVGELHAVGASGQTRPDTDLHPRDSTDERRPEPAPEPPEPPEQGTA